MLSLMIIELFALLLHPLFRRVLSSAGLERILDRDEVTCSNQVAPTETSSIITDCRCLFFILRIYN